MDPSGIDISRIPMLDIASDLSIMEGRNGSGFEEVALSFFANDFSKDNLGWSLFCPWWLSLDLYAFGGLLLPGFGCFMDDSLGWLDPFGIDNSRILMLDVASDLVIMEGHNRSGFEEVVLSSIANDFSKSHLYHE
ncbi:hypothetical protein V6N13_110721 [Hibiscus sabdariffa]|uniref:Uncharacterized protein n=1 Tax=Hibiscus sabdariffa TaxID=183260 RepID=A0ABR2TI30_9ROSI